jgi:acetylornithine deacetylase/succinyl-diaminopimelate desuccinylase-like protein
LKEKKKWEVQICPAFLIKNRRSLQCDAVVISDTGMPGLEYPALTYALRGIAALEIKVSGPSRDLHSGIYGGSVDNPAMALAQMLGSLRDARGRVAFPGSTMRATAYRRLSGRNWRESRIGQASIADFWVCAAFWGERGYSSIEQRSARPTLEINGLTSGYQGEGSKTIIPAWASAKLTLRLVPDQDPIAITRLGDEVSETPLSPHRARLEVEAGHGADPYLVSPRSELAQAGIRACERAFGHEPVLMREGGSIPIVTEFRRVLGVDSLLLGLALPEANAHSPNESFHLDAFAGGCG